MKGSLLLAMLMLAPTEAVVNDGESLAQVAQRTLGDRGGASELKALNGLKGDTVAPGTKLKLPGPDRAKAQSALETARNVMKQAAPQVARREEAVAKLKEAEVHFQQARYAEASQAADESTRLLSSRSAPQPLTAFSLEVGKDGATTVKSISGKPVTVENEAGTQSVPPGHSTRVEKGHAPPPPRPPLSVPHPTQPADKLRLSVKPAKGGLGPITLSWQAVEGAETYQVELVPVKGEKQVLTASSPHLKVTLPAAGLYRWSVRALTRDMRSEASPEQGFEVAESPAKPINVQVQPTNWK